MSGQNYTKHCSACTRSLPASFFYVDASKKDGLSTHCRECKKAQARSYRAANIDTVRRKGREYAAKNRTQATQRKKDWYEANKADVLVKCAEYRARNPEKVRDAKLRAYEAKPEHYRRYTQQWKKANPGVHEAWRRANAASINARNAVRRASKLQATPPWADQAKIAAVYAEASRRRAAGEDVEVDHMVPLRGKNVRGLHVHYNLQIIPAIDNRRKRNRFADTDLSSTTSCS